MKILHSIFTIVALLASAGAGNSQSFVNLNFESANLTGFTAGGFVPATNAFPNWTVSAGYVLYDNFSLSGESISIMDTNSPYFTTTIQGQYYALLVSGNYPGSGYAISLGQTGTIPLSAESMIFWGAIGGMQITFNGQPLSFSSVSSTANYTVYEADVSAYAGQTGQLLFTLPPYLGSANLDNIQFSPSPVPEPSTLGLSVLGGLFLVFRRWKTRAV